MTRKPSRFPLTRVLAPASCGLAIAVLLHGLGGGGDRGIAAVPASVGQPREMPFGGGTLRGGIADRALTPDEDPPVRLSRGVEPGDGWFVTRLGPDGAVAENVGTYGSLSEKSYFRFVIVRGDARGDDGLFPEIARRAAETGAGLVRLTTPTDLMTRMGNMSVAATELEDAEGRRAACHAFRLMHRDLEIGAAGWLCDAGADATRAERLVCLIDHLALSPSADYLPLRVAFREAASRAPACRPAPADIAATIAAAAVLDGATAAPAAVAPPRRSRRSRQRPASMEPGGPQRITSPKTVEATASMLGNSQFRR